MQAVDYVAITGSMGSGKSTTMAEASNLLTFADIEHAAIDLDALGLAHLGRDHETSLLWRTSAYPRMACG